MPELPEVQTTVEGLNSTIVGKRIVDIWTDWPKMFKDGGFAHFKKAVVGADVKSASRRGKHVLIHLSNGWTIIVHMKMTGHLLYGKYKQIPYSNVLENIGIRKGVGKTNKLSWVPTDKKGPLNDPFNRFIHFVALLSNGKQLAFSDMRKFGKIALAKTDELEHSPHLSHLGPEPLEKSFDYAKFATRLKEKPHGRVKTVLMDQSVIAGIGNIYSDEMLWRAGIHPETKIEKLKDKKIKELFKAMKEVLRGGIEFGGDSMSDYRNIYGESGHYQERHHVYQRKGEKCDKRGCSGIIVRKVVGGRSAHFCSVHQR